MTSEERQQLKVKITQTISEMETEIERLEDATQPIAPENSLGRITRMDAINNKSVAEAALRSTRRKLSKLQMSLNKIDSPGFGTCSQCKKPIQPARLMYMPESSMCVKCAR